MNKSRTLTFLHHLRRICCSYARDNFGIIYVVACIASCVLRVISCCITRDNSGYRETENARGSCAFRNRPRSSHYRLIPTMQSLSSIFH